MDLAGRFRGISFIGLGGALSAPRRIALKRRSVSSALYCPSSSRLIGFVMTDFGWPTYPLAPPEYLHALGAVSANFNKFEGALYGFFQYYLQRANLPLPIIEKWYGAAPSKRSETTEFIIRLYETETAVVSHFEFLKEYFQICEQNRHTLMHSRVLSIEGETINVVKRNKDYSDLLYRRIGILHLRRIADEIYAGYAHARDVLLYVSRRDSHLPPHLLDTAPSSLPPMPALAENLEYKSSHPIQTEHMPRP